MPKTKRYKIYSYPYLSEFTDGFEKTQFKLEIRYKYESKKILIDASYSIDNDSIVELIKNKTVRVVLKVVCSPMGYSDTLIFNNDSTTLSYLVNSNKIDGEVSFIAYLVANKDFVLEGITDLSKTWASEKPHIVSNNILGESIERIVNMKHIPSGMKKSIFKFTYNTNKEDTDPYSVYLTDDNAIKFVLSKHMKNMFDSIEQNEKTRPFVFSLFIIPALADILRQMINVGVEQNGFNTEHSNKRWYKVIVDNYTKAFPGKDPTDEGSALIPLEAAQMLIDKLAINNSIAKAKLIIRM